MAMYAESNHSGPAPVYEYQRPEYGSGRTENYSRTKSQEEIAKVEEAVRLLNAWQSTK